MKLFFAAAALCASAHFAHGAAVDYFLKIEGVDGESKVENHVGEIEISSFSWGATNSSSLGSAGGGAGAGKAQISPLSFTKTADKTSPKLFGACATGQHFKTAVLVGTLRGSSDSEVRGKEQPYMKLTLQDVLVSSYQVGGQAGDGRPTEVLSLNFTKITYAITTQTQTGKVGDVITSGFDLKKNIGL
jgi:type VI secretion system secreted protein Hcp